MTNASMVFLATAVALLPCSCATHHASYHTLSAIGVSSREIDSVLNRNPLPSGQDILVTPLTSTEAVSHFLVQVRHAESLHVHRDHDLTVFVYRGRGRMRMGDGVFAVREGDIIFTPRGIPHAFENTSTEPSVAIAIFTPSFDANDTVPVAK